ncbi:zinc metalloproteinase-disintegrin-like 4a [Maniola hyperantus]|uniref:zinc metalloproteinase-disintegrin-like 4a n=1 Tax=Aphantopus hyperantus TaxID=2795564 RepID=UPI001568898E|nr:zinc metalloproteinase-disintegrin-like crotastatin [Maniola hyperantus]
MLENSLNVKMYGGSLVVFCLFLSYLRIGSEAQEIKNPATDFRRHEIVQPVLQHGRTKREITTTRHKEGLHHPEVTMTLNIDGEKHILDLKLNENLLAGDHTISYQKNGSMVTYKPSIEELDICQYSGKVRGKKDSWVAVSTCHGVRGVIHDGNQMRYIEPAQVVDTEIGSKHFIYDHSDLMTKSSCGHDAGVTNNTEYDPELMKRHLSEQSNEWRRSNRYKRDTSEDKQIRGPFNVNNQSRFVELVLVADNAAYIESGWNINTVHQQLKDVANIIYSLYAPLNIFIALVGVEVWTEQNKIHIVEAGDTTLTNFLHYRREILNNLIPNDNAHLLTLTKFKSGVLGNNLKGPICTSEYSGGVAVNHSVVIGLVATTIAHGLGHNFGMEHDNEFDCDCPDEKCIMSPNVDSVAPTRWSDCSRRSLALAFERGMDHCLRNKPKSLFDSPTCGNGFVEPGEQCDCGLSPDPACAVCCQPLTCALRSNATCASGECCDTMTCQPKSAGTECRSAEGECDLPEFCTGHSEFCPKDVFMMDATPCSDDQAYCVDGSCSSHSDQCRLLWGSTGVNAHHKCYELNRRGDRQGNCGYDRSTRQYQCCSSEDELCGRMQCIHLNEQLEYGMESASILSSTFVNYKGQILACRTAQVDLGTRDVDPGMVPDGAKCGEDKMCLKQKCVSVTDVRALMARQSSVCPSDCSGHGVCNSEGNCHCDVGFTPPLCVPVGGGSIDSGPATKPDFRTFNPCRGEIGG